MNLIGLAICKNDIQGVVVEPCSSSPQVLLRRAHYCRGSCPGEALQNFRNQSSFQPILFLLLTKS